MKFRYTILINGTNGAVQKDIEADNISKATITAKARVKEIWGLTAKLKQKIISREKDFYKDEYYSQNKETGRYKKEFTLMVKALNKSQDTMPYIWHCDLYVKGGGKVAKYKFMVTGQNETEAKQKAEKEAAKRLGVEKVTISGKIKKAIILSKTQDSQSRVFDRLFRVLDKVQDDRQTENKFKTYIWHIYYYFYYKGKKSNIEKGTASGRNKDDALKDFKRNHPFHPSQKMTIVKVELAPKTLKPIQGTLRQNKKMEQIRNKKIGDSQKPFRIVATYRTSGKKRSFLVLANSFNEAKNKVKRHYEKSGLQGILSDIEKFEGYEIKSIPTEKFKKHYGNKEVIEN